MEENRLIDRHTKYKGKFNSEGNSKIASGAIFSQVGNTSEEKKNQSVKNNNGQFCIPVGETPVPGKDGTIVCYKC